MFLEILSFLLKGKKFVNTLQLEIAKYVDEVLDYLISKLTVIILNLYT